jgi:hypothetical protein
MMTDEILYKFVEGPKTEWLGGLESSHKFYNIYRYFLVSHFTKQLFWAPLE